MLVQSIMASPRMCTYMDASHEPHFIKTSRWCLNSTGSTVTLCFFHKWVKYSLNQVIDPGDLVLEQTLLRALGGKDYHPLQLLFQCYIHHQYGVVAYKQNHLVGVIHQCKCVAGSIVAVQMILVSMGKCVGQVRVFSIECTTEHR